MTIKEKFDKIGELFTSYFSKENETTEVNIFKAITLKDGTALTVDVLEVGGMVTDAEQKPVAANDYELEDGTIITVNSEGKITEVKPMEVVENAEVPAEIPAEVPTETPEDSKKAIEDLTMRVAKIEEFLASIGIQLSELNEQFSKIELIPTETPLGENNTIIESKIEKNDRISSFKKAFKK